MTQSAKEPFRCNSADSSFLVTTFPAHFRLLSQQPYKRKAVSVEFIVFQQQPVALFS